MPVKSDGLNSSVAQRPAYETRPGFSPERLGALSRERILDTNLNLDGRTVLTEAATGVYAVTPILAALAGARRVFALARDSRHGSANAAISWLCQVAEIAGVADTIAIVDRVPAQLLGEVDIVTNSGHLRPINRDLIDALPRHAVIALMFEAWERRESDLDFGACKRRDIRVVGVNERHPSVDVFNYLGCLAVRLLHDAGVAVYRSRIAVVCDNDFLEPLLAGLIGQGATVAAFPSIRDLPVDSFDVVLVALQPKDAVLNLDAHDAFWLASNMPHAIIAQFWGDIDRSALAECGMALWPPAAPERGHMSVLLSEIGPEPIARLQAGGLKAAEIALSGVDANTEGLAQFI